MARCLLVAAALTACTAPPPADGVTVKLERIKVCESHGNYRAISPTGTYRGAYQFSRRTWDSIARRWLPTSVGEDPAAAPAATQDHLARRLYAERGWRPWPVCGRR